MSSVLVTGGAGFIGSNFTKFLVEQAPGVQLTVLDSLTYAGNVTGIASSIRDGRIRFEHGSILDSALVGRLLMECDIDTIVHFAAESHVDRSISGAAVFIETNIVGTYALLESAKAYWKTASGWRKNVRFHHVSTDEVYGSLAPTDPAFQEVTPYGPNSPYAASKASSDHLVRAWNHTYGLPVSITNCSNNYGPFQFPEKLIPLVIINALQGKPLPVYGDGKQVRDWLHVLDHCRAIWQVLQSHDATGETYNVGGNAEVENIQLVRMICETIDIAFREDPALREAYAACPASQNGACADLITHVKDRAGHDRRYAVNTQRIQAAIGWKPLETLGSGIAATVRWYIKNREWWAAVIDGSYRDWVERQYGTFSGTAKG